MLMTIFSRAGEHLLSPLARTVAAQGMARQFQAYNTNYRNAGLFGVSGVVEAEASEAFCYAVLKAMRELPEMILDDELFEATKIKVGFLFLILLHSRHWVLSPCLSDFLCINCP